jgi:hypothetical protein
MRDDFDSYYWRAARLGDVGLECARQEVGAADDGVALRAFQLLISNSRVAARGIALDHFHHDEAIARFGVENVFGRLRSQVLQTARALLADPPVRKGDDGASIDGANHASALGALLNLAEPQDADRIADILDARPDHVVLELALQCADTVLGKDAHQTALGGAVRRLAEDPRAPARDRGLALHLVDLTEPGLAEQLALSLIQDEDLRLQADAAWLLAERDLARHRRLLEGVVAAWPETAPYPAFEVRQLLD